MIEIIDLGYLTAAHEVVRTCASSPTPERVILNSGGIICDWFVMTVSAKKGGKRPVEEGNNAEPKPCAVCAFREAGICAGLLKAESSPGRARLSRRFHKAARRQVIHHAGMALKNFYILCEGWAMRQMVFDDGRRQILSLLLPGEPVWLHGPDSQHTIFSIQTLTDARYCVIEPGSVAELTASDPDCQAVVRRSLIRERLNSDRHLMELGRLTAEERVAHLILHLYDEMDRRALTNGHVFPLPLRQQQMADYLGLTPTHVSRVLTLFRKQSFIRIGKETMEIVDMAGLRRAAGMRSR